MKSTSEFIKFDDEDHGNTDYEEGVYPYGIHKFQKDHMLFLCYYEPTKNGTFHSHIYCEFYEHLCLLNFLLRETKEF